MELKPKVEYKIGKPGTPVMCEQDGVIANSLPEMARLKGMSLQLLLKHLSGKAKHAKGFTFKYVEVKNNE